MSDTDEFGTPLEVEPEQKVLKDALIDQAENIAEGLRNLADWYEQNPHLLEYINEPSVYATITNFSKEEKPKTLEGLALIAKAIAPCSKDFGDYNIALSTEKDGGIFEPIAFTASLSRTAVCTKIVRWDCPPSILKVLETTEEELEKVRGY